MLVDVEQQSQIFGRVLIAIESDSCPPFMRRLLSRSSIKIDGGLGNKSLSASRRLEKMGDGSPNVLFSGEDEESSSSN